MIDCVPFSCTAGGESNRARIRQSGSRTTKQAVVHLTLWCPKVRAPNLDGRTHTTYIRNLGLSHTGLDVSELRQLKQLREENRRLKTAVADLTLDKTILRDALGKKWRTQPTPRGRGLGKSRVSTWRAPRVSSAPGAPRDDSVRVGEAGMTRRCAGDCTRLRRIARALARGGCT